MKKANGIGSKNTSLAKSIQTSYWGYSFWSLLHYLGSLATTTELYNKFIELLMYLQFLLPCDNCKNHFTIMIKGLTFKYANEMSAFDLTYVMHATVNSRLGNASCTKEAAYRQFRNINVNSIFFNVMSCIAFSIEPIKNKLVIVNNRKITIGAAFYNFMLLVLEFLAIKNNNFTNQVSPKINYFESVCTNATYGTLYEAVNGIHMNCNKYGLSNMTALTTNCGNCH